LNSLTGKIAAFFVFVAVFSYVILRAIYVPICNDETVSFFSYISDGHFIPFYNAPDFSANNHVLNSLFSWIFYRFFGPNAFALRLPNVLAFLLYGVYAYKYARLFKSNALQYVAFLALVLSSYYFLDFFSLSRGYGLSYAFFMASFYHLIQANSGIKTRFNLLLSFLFVSLAVLANLGFLISYCIWWFFAVLILLRQKRSAKTVLFALLPSVPLGFFVSLSLRIKEAGELYHGQETLGRSLWTLITRLLPIQNYTQLYIVLGFISFMLMLAIWLVIKKGIFKVAEIHVAVGFLAGNIFGALLLHVGFDVPFPSSRTSLHWFLCFLLLLPQLGQFASGAVRKIALASASICIVLLGFYSLKNANTKISAEYFWNKDQIPTSFYTKIEAIQNAEKRQLSIATQRTYTTYNLAFLNAAHPSSILSLGKEFKTDPKMLADVCIANVTEFPELLKAYAVLEEDSSSGLSLLQRKTFLKREGIDASQKSFSNMQDDFIALHTGPISAQTSNICQVDFNVQVLGEVEPYNGLLFVSLDDSLGNQVYYEHFRTWFFLADKNAKRQIVFNCIIEEVPKNAHRISVLLWNLNHQKLQKVESEVVVKQLFGPNEISIFEQ